MAGILSICSLHTVLVVFFLAIARTAVGLNIAYCSSDNTGSDFAEVTNHYQSNGACFQTCVGQYAFAVLRGSQCWCSDYVPAATTSTASCNQPCPGYPSDLCGSSTESLFAYIALRKSPSGTAGGSSSSPTSTIAPSSVTSVVSQVTPSTTAVVQTTQAISSSSTSSTSTTTSSTSVTPMSTTSTSTTSTSTTPASTTSTSTAAAAILIPTTPATTFTTTWTPTPMTSVITVTGQVKTITITPTQPAAATGTQTLPEKSSSGFLSNTGKVAGLFVGVALIFFIAAALAILLCLRRRRNRVAAGAGPNAGGGETPQRRPSRLSEMALVGRKTGEKSLPSIRTSGWGPSIGGEKSPDDTITPADGRRSSFPLIVDQRLDPITVWNPIHANGSHVSVRSFRDDQDYSRRMLRVANPDH
ncbi:MAG: hypothetical protein LQ347_005624 [Umbilicaria vellea]|nr:MAG: hypothetical protein LQ347_005624 [Umbilicaria vellea]